MRDKKHPKIHFPHKAMLFEIMAINNNIHVGLCGGGLGGLTAAIAMARAGAQVTVLEAAAELKEIGAGIQMTPNVSRLLIKWGVAEVIGNNLVEFEELNMRGRDGSKVGYTKMIPDIQRNLGYPWWVVHRAHLHDGLAKVALKYGVEILTNSRVEHIDYLSNDRVTVTTAADKQHTFDLLIGSDGINSVVRGILFPDVIPSPPTRNSAYRATVPYSEIRKNPIAKELIEKRSMEVWMSENSYIIAYPISDGNVCNLVLSHHPDHYVDHVEDIDIHELRDQYKDYDPRIKEVVDMISEAQRWPLLVTGPMASWSSPRKNVVLIGDAAHSMVNHMAQGAATSMEDGAFLGRCIHQVIHNNLSLPQAIDIYESHRMPKAYFKQQISFINGVIWQLPEGPAQQARDLAMSQELKGEPLLRSPNLYGDPRMALAVYAYDAEDDAERAICEFLKSRRPNINIEGNTTKEVEDTFMNWFLASE